MVTAGQPMEFLRQLDLVSPETLDLPVHLIGCGGIGSFTALLLSKMGCRHLRLYDPDGIEEHNLPNQLFRLSDVGRLKVEALREILEEFAGAPVEVHPVEVEAQRMTGVVISGVDTMLARKAIWQRSIRYRAGVLRYLDARMGAEVARIYTVKPADPDDIRFYEKSLYDDEEAEVLPCTAAAISYSGFAIASLIGNLVKRLVTGEDLPREVLLDLKTLTLLTSSGGRS
ncbi:MAG: ThiF family adenylyltransferase [Candidatus Methylomirabilales bacterium]